MDRLAKHYFSCSVLCYDAMFLKHSFVVLLQTNQDSNWTQRCGVSVSPAMNFMCVYHSDKAVFLDGNLSHNFAYNC